MLGSPFREIVEQVNDGARDKATLLKLDQAQWNAGVDPMDTRIQAVVESMQRKEGTCTQVGDENATREELEEAIKEVGHFAELAQKFANGRFLSRKGAKTKITNLSAFENTWRHLISGSSKLPAPTTQNVAARLLGIFDGGLNDDDRPRHLRGWKEYRLLLESGTQAGLRRFGWMFCSTRVTRKFIRSCSTEVTRKFICSRARCGTMVNIM